MGPACHNVICDQRTITQMSLEKGPQGKVTAVDLNYLLLPSLLLTNSGDGKAQQLMS